MDPSEWGVDSPRDKPKRNRDLRWARNTAPLIAICAILLGWRGVNAGAQEQQPGQVSSRTTTVHGFVRNGVSGSPLPRALVHINGDAASGVLTDGDGRFEIPDVPEGPQEFSIAKPGYLDAFEGGTETIAYRVSGVDQNVIVSAEMGDLVFTMQPVNSIVGQIQLSTGDVAEGIQVTLLKGIVQDGRATWQIATAARTNSDGRYRFGDLSAGLYAVYTEATMDNEGSAGIVEKGSGNRVMRQGYPTTFYPDAHDVAGAAKIRLAGGDQAQANMTLTLETYQTVTATVTMPGARAGGDVSVQVMDAQGHQLSYAAQYDSSTHTVQAALPDGTYSFQAELMQTRPMEVMSNGERIDFSVRSPAPIAGQVTFAVAGRAVSNLHLPMSTAVNTPVQVTTTHNPESAQQTSDPRLYIGLTQASEWMSGNITYGLAEGNPSALTQHVHPPPGSYWVHTSIAPFVLCETSFNAGGVSLAREPLVINESRSAVAPLVLALRDDCAKLTLTLPGSLGMSTGIEPFFTVYVVPEFDSTVDIVPQTLRLSTGGRATMSGLTPGNYRVYTFDHPVSLEYRNPAVLQGLSSQEISLSPNAEAQLTVEAGQP